MAARGKQLRSDCVLGRMVRETHNVLSLWLLRDKHIVATERQASPKVQGVGCMAVWHGCMAAWSGVWPHHRVAYTPACW